MEVYLLKKYIKSQKEWAIVNVYKSYEATRKAATKLKRDTSVTVFTALEKY